MLGNPLNYNSPLLCHSLDHCYLKKNQRSYFQSCSHCPSQNYCYSERQLLTVVAVVDGDGGVIVVVVVVVVVVDQSDVAFVSCDLDIGLICELSVACDSFAYYDDERC